MTWRNNANCTGTTDPRIFDATIDDDGREHPEDRTARHNQALAICAPCTVRDACLAEALEDHVEGVRGGVVLRPIPVMRRPDQHRTRVQPPTILHGTDMGYRAHHRRGVPFTADCGCREAHRRVEHERRVRYGQRTA